MRIYSISKLASLRHWSDQSVKIEEHTFKIQIWKNYRRMSYITRLFLIVWSKRLKKYPTENSKITWYAMKWIVMDWVLEVVWSNGLLNASWTFLPNFLLFLRIFQSVVCRWRCAMELWKIIKKVAKKWRKTC